jgi:shikimate kinase
MNVYLIGYMGSGKTTVGRGLARKLGYTHLDLDDFFEQSYKITVTDFFSKYDEQAFRAIESTLLKKTPELKNHIISTGGGTPCFFDNMDIINENGLSVYLKMSPKSLFDRLKKAKRPRPRIQNLSGERLYNRIIQDLQSRETYYNRAQVIVKGESIDLDTLAEKISFISKSFS